MEEKIFISISFVFTAKIVMTGKLGCDDCEMFLIKLKAKFE